MHKKTSSKLVIHNIHISSSAHRILNNTRGISHYIDSGFVDLTDFETCHELEPQGLTHVKRFMSIRNGQGIEFNTSLINCLPNCDLIDPHGQLQGESQSIWPTFSAMMYVTQ